jgi:hypothetical protein
MAGRGDRKAPQGTIDWWHTVLRTWRFPWAYIGLPALAGIVGIVIRRSFHVIMFTKPRIGYQWNSNDNKSGQALPYAPHTCSANRGCSQHGLALAWSGLLVGMTEEEVSQLEQNLTEESCGKYCERMDCEHEDGWSGAGFILSIPGGLL